MFDSLVNAIGGYNSWQFAVLSLGSLAIGFGLYAFRWYLFPIVGFGTLLIYSWLSNEAIKTAISTGKDWANVIPIFFPVMVIIVLVKIKLEPNHSKDKDKTNEE